MERGLAPPMNFDYCEYCLLYDDYKCDNCNYAKQEKAVKIKTLEERREERFRGRKERFPERKERFPERKEGFSERKGRFPERKERFPEKKEMFPEKKERFPDKKERFTEKKGRFPERFPERKERFPERKGRFPERTERFPESKVNESLKAKKQNLSPVSKKECGKKTFQAKFKQDINQGRLDGMGSILSQLGI